MLQEEQLNLFADVLYQRIVSVNEQYLDTIGKRFAEVGTLTGTQAHQLRQILKYQTADVAKIEKALATAMQKNLEDVQTILETIAKDNLDFAEPYFEAKKKEFIPYASNVALINLTESMVKTAKNDLENMTKSTAVSSIYKQALTEAVTKAQLGLETYQTAIKSVIRDVADKGIYYIDYENGYRRRLDSSVRQSVLYAMKQTNINSAEKVGEQFGADGWEISYHSSPRKSHEWFAGLQFSKKDFVAKGVESLMSEYGCLHFKYAVELGLSEPAYSKKQLDELKKRDEEIIEYSGKELTRYEATQIMRKMETEVRKNKDALVVAKSAKNKTMQNELNNSIRQIQKEYKNVAKTFGLSERGERMRIVKT